MRQETGQLQNHPERASQTQPALRLQTPPTPSGVLEKPGVLYVLRKIANHHPFVGVAEQSIPDPEILGERGARFATMGAGVCGSDQRIARLAMGFDALANVPNVQKSDPTLFDRIMYRDGQRMLRSFTLGHEIVARNEEGKLGVIYPVIACASKFGEGEGHCLACKNGQENHCQKRMEGPVRGLSLGTGAVTEQGKELGGGFSSSFVAYKDQFIPLPDGMDPLAAVMTDAYACAVNGVNMAAYRGRFDRGGKTLVVGMGPIGFSVVSRLRNIGVNDITVIAKHPAQQKLAERLGCQVVGSERKGVEELAESIGASVDQYAPRSIAIDGGQKFDTVFECVGSPDAVDTSLQFTKSDGYMVALGLAGTVNIGERRQVGVLSPFWASRNDYYVALTDLQRMPDVADYIDKQGTLDRKLLTGKRDPGYIKTAYFPNTK